jgi:hypothetical protein
MVEDPASSWIGPWDRPRGGIRWHIYNPIGNPKIIDCNPLSAVIKGICCEGDGKESTRNMRRNLDS